MALKTYQVALQPSHEVTSSEKPAEGGTPREGPEARWRAIDRIKHQIREEKGVFDREARIKALEEFKRAATATSWSVRGCLYRIIQALLRYLNLFALLLSRLFFFEFPNNLRHLCTTMPWSIWPALVVLWGVCWMFYENTDRHIAPQGMCVISIVILFVGLTKQRTRDAAAGVPAPSRSSAVLRLACILLRSPDAPAHRGS